jgi:hypothetical protein
MKSISKLTAVLFAACAFSVPYGSAFAHDDAAMDTMKAPNGGQLRMAGIYHYELVLVKNLKGATENTVLVFVTDHAGAKVVTTGATGTATLLAGKLKSSVKLMPDGDNRLKGIGVYSSTSDLKAIVAITMPGKQPEQARFTPMSTIKDEQADHKH